MTPACFRADLHCHSNCSDGSLPPLELLEMAKQIGLKGLSITDHDTLDAYTKPVFEKAEKIQLALLPGVEISSECDGFSVHLLGYGFEIDSPALREFLQKIQERRQERNRSILKKLSVYKMEISEEELKEFAHHRTVGRPHIAQLLVKKGYVRSTRDAFQNYLGEGALCHAFGIRFTPLEVIAAIHQAKGCAVLAHPHFIRKGSLLRKLLDLPFDGIECYYGKLDKALELPWLKLAKERGWIATGGSDYHGDFRPDVPLGSSWVCESTFEKLSQFSASREKKGRSDG